MGSAGSKLRRSDVAVLSGKNPEAELRVWGRVGRRLTDSDAKIVAEHLKTNTTLVKLLLGASRIGEEGARVLAEALRENRTLQQLSLTENIVGDEGTRHLAEALRENCTLTTLDLYDNKMGDEGARFLADALRENSTLQEINLAHNTFGPEGARDFAEALRANSTLQRLDLWENNLRDEGARHLVEALRENSGLQYLDLRECNLGAETARHLAEALRANSTLQGLYLARNNNVGTEGVRFLAEALHEHSTLQQLDLSDIALGPEAASYLADMLRVNSTLQHLNTLRCDLGDEGVRSIARALGENPNLALTDLNGIDLSAHLDALGFPPEYAYSRTESILKCLQEWNRDGVVETRRTKVMIVGPSGAGKTALVHRLRTFEFLPDAQTTDGIEIHDFTRYDVTLHLWDFGGHPDLLKTHRVFFSNRAILLLVFDPRHHKLADLEPYLEAVRKCAPDAPLVPVLTHCAELSALPQSTLDEIAERHGAFAGLAAVDSLTGAALDGIQTIVSGGLAELLPVVAKAQSYVTQKVPRQLLKLQQHLSDLSKPPHSRFHMPTAEFRALAQDQFGMSAEASEQMLGLLHDWGTAYVLPGGEQIVLAPQQLSDALRAAIKHAQGPLAPSEADEVWQQYDSELRPLFLELLRECGLVADS